MNTEEYPERKKKGQSPESAEKRTGDITHGSKDMYETERKIAGKLIGIERGQYAFVFLILLAGLTAGLFLLGASYHLAAIVGGLGALVLIIGALFVRRDRKSGIDGKRE